MKALPLLFMLLPLIASAQLSEDFSDGDFSDNPAWFGDTAMWRVLDGKLNSHFEEKSGDPQVVYQLSTRSGRVEGTIWEFWVKTGTTSKNNFIRIFLVSQDSLPRYDKPNDGYFVEIGGTPDNVVLYKKDSLAYTPLITGREDITDHAELKIKAICTRQHHWRLYTDADDNGYILEGTATDSAFVHSRFFNIVVFQKGKSANSSHWFDNISVRRFVPDTVPPVLTKLLVEDKHHIQLQFSEALADTVLSVSHFNMDDRNPDSVSFLSGDPSVLSLYFEKVFQQKKTYSIHLSDMEDVSGNRMDTTLHFTYFIPGAYDVVIDEMYADPTPSQGLPEAEYVELLNRSGYPVHLAGWKLCDQTKCNVLPSVTLAPDSLLIVCDAEDAAALSSYGKVAGVSHFISLNNSGDELYLKNGNEQMIYSVSYTQSSYGDKEKAKGGWSLELQYPAYPCLVSGNWAASLSLSGGSPGRPNKVKPHQKPFLDLEYVAVIDSLHLRAQFNATLDTFAIKSAIFTIPGAAIADIAPDTEFLTGVELTLRSPLKRRKVYSLHVQNMTACGLTTGVQNEASFGLPEAATLHDVVINEVLFNPKEGGADFVELYNASKKIIDLRTLFLANKDNGSIDDLYAVADQLFYLLPAHYVAVTTNKNYLLHEYVCKNPNAIVTINNMPSYPNASGTILLVDAHKKEIDKMHYDERDQSPFFHNEEGVSLERVNPLAPATDKNNWASASSISGYATPGYRNSQFMFSQQGTHFFKVDPEIFSPNGDGMDDVLYLKYTLSPGYAATIRVYNEYGRLVRHLQSNITLSTKGTIQWNGKDDNGVVMPTGIYIVYIELYHSSGIVRTYKLPVTLVKRR